MNKLNVSLAMFALALVSLNGSEAMAQRGGMRMMMGGGAQLHSELLAMKEVQGELKLNDEQKEKIVAAATEIRDAWNSERRSIMREGGEQSEIDDLLKDLKSEEKELVAALDDKQKKRLKQLMIQRMGNAAFQHDAVVKELNISDEQKKEIGNAFDNSRSKMEEAMAEMRESGDFQGMRTAMTDMQTDLKKSLMSILNEDQESKLKELQGDKFEFPERQRGGRGRRNF